MGCRKREKLIVDCLTGELKGTQALKLEEHLKTCEDCRKTLAEYSGLLAETRELREPVYDGTFWTARLNEVKNHEPRRQFRSFLRPMFISVFALALLAVFALKIFGPDDNKLITPPANNCFVTELDELPYPEDTLMAMVDYMDDDSVEKLLNIILENNLMSAHIR